MAGGMNDLVLARGGHGESSFRSASAVAVQKPPRQPSSTGIENEAVGSGRRLRAAGVALLRFFSRSGEGGCGRKARALCSLAGEEAPLRPRPRALKRAARGVASEGVHMGGVKTPSESSDSLELELLQLNAGVGPSMACCAVAEK
jgi:hypothetical protein